MLVKGSQRPLTLLLAIGVLLWLTCANRQWTLRSRIPFLGLTR